MRISASTRPAAITTIPPVPGDVERPFWSVMIPTYNPAGLLEKTLRSVLDQDPGPDRMEIVVVDDCSPNGKSEQVVRRLAPGRVGFYRQPSNIGLAGNWNWCISRSRGNWVHILHQDDLVLPGFYGAMERATQGYPGLGAAFCRYGYIDDAGVRTSDSELERPTAGVLEGWLEEIAVLQRIECPAIVVNRAVYERLGGFTPELCFALDWEMWVRIAANYPVWYDPEVLACYRRHEANATTRLQRAGADLPDVVAALDWISRHVPPHRRGELRREAERRMRWRWHREANRLMEAGRWWPALAQIRRAYQLESLSTRSKALLGYSKWAIKVGLRGLVPRAMRDNPANA